MSRRKRRDPFWQMWSETRQDVDRDAPETSFDVRAAWREFFAEFLGVAPEQHWLFGGRRFKHSHPPDAKSCGV